MCRKVCEVSYRLILFILKQIALIEEEDKSALAKSSKRKIYSMSDGVNNK